jgi:tubulin polyglutamylase TTLL4
MADAEPCVFHVRATASVTKREKQGTPTPMPTGDSDPAAAEELQEQSVPALPAAPKPKRQIMLLPSVFEGRPPVILFTYTQACLAKQRPLERMVMCDINGPKMYYSHTDAVHEYNAVINSLRQGGLYRVKSENRRWSVLWSSHPPPEVLRIMKPNQKTNHFPGSWHLGRKDLLWRAVSKMHRRFGRTYNITPQGYILPKGMKEWDANRARQPDALWIWKPCGQSCGRGIKVLSSEISEADLKDLQRKRGICQRYIPNPLLINGFKFDLRVYVVVVSYDPLKVYVNTEGLVRLATVKYSTDKSSLECRTMHLTNYSVNKLSSDFVQNKDAVAKVDDEDDDMEQPEEPDGNASKWSFAELRRYFEQKGLDYDAAFSGINDLVIKTLLAVEPQIVGEWSRALENESAGWGARGPAGAHPASCFETYGFDVLIDQDLKSWLLEVNICPSLSSGSPLDKRIKTKLVADTLTLVGINPLASIYRSLPAAKPDSSKMTDVVPEDDDSGLARMPAADVLAKRKARLAIANRTDALALFDEYAWDIIVKAHDEDMRCGGLKRIFPTPEASQYTSYFTEESYANLVLRKWHEAGGGELFRLNEPQSPIPPWVPRQVCFSST